jgi:hypothetical protein
MAWKIGTAGPADGQPTKRLGPVGALFAFLAAGSGRPDPMKGEILKEQIARFVRAADLYLSQVAEIVRLEGPPGRPADPGKDSFAAALQVGLVGMRLDVLEAAEGLPKMLESNGSDSSALLAFVNAVDNVDAGVDAAALRALWSPAKVALQQMAIRSTLPAAKPEQGKIMDPSPRADRGEDVAPANQPPTEVQPRNAEVEQASELKAFSGGTMVFYADRVELCGVTICGGARSKRRHDALNLLRVRKGQRFVAYSGEELAGQVGLKTGQNGAAGLVRDIRERITDALRSQANINCVDEDVILSGGPGYRFADCISVQDGDQPDTGHNTDITDMGSEGDVRNVRNDDVRNVRNDDVRNVRNDDVRNVRNDDVRNVRNDDVRNVRNVPNGDVPNVRNGDVPDVPDDAAETRRVWILQRLAEGHQLRAPDVVKEFRCSVKTAQRDLQALKEKEKIEFVGATRTGFYRLRKPSSPGQ